MDCECIGVQVEIKKYTLQWLEVEGKGGADYGEGNYLGPHNGQVVREDR